MRSLTVEAFVGLVAVGIATAALIPAFAAAARRLRARGLSPGWD